MRLDSGEVGRGRNLSGWSHSALPCCMRAWLLSRRRVSILDATAGGCRGLPTHLRSHALHPHLLIHIQLSTVCGGKQETAKDHVVYTRRRCSPPRRCWIFRHGQDLPVSIPHSQQNTMGSTLIYLGSLPPRPLPVARRIPSASWCLEQLVVSPLSPQVFDFHRRRHEAVRRILAVLGLGLGSSLTSREARW